MKKLFIYTVLICAVFCSSCSEEYDDSALWNGLNSLEARVVKLEELCKQLNTNISALQTIVYALQNNDYVTGVAPITKDGEIVGYTITFTKSPSITIYNGKDGQNGADGYTPIIGVKQDVDGVYYWTLDGDWLLDADGNRIKTQGADGKDGIDGKDGKDGADGKDGVDGKDGENGTDGKDGVDGKDGEDGADGKDGVDGKDGENGTDGKDGVDGKDGKDGITPKLKIENGYWYVSYDEGSSWEKLGKATGADGQDGEDGTDGEDGEDGEDGDNIFSSVTQDDEYVYFNLSDGTIITLQKQEKENIKFEDIYVKMICCNNWDTNNDGELSYSEAAAVQNIGTVFKGNTKIVAFSELKYFTGINIIPQEAFSNCTSLWKVSIPANVTTIEKYAFNKCSNLYNLIISEGVSKIGYGAFSWCTSLTNLTIPNSVIEIDNLAFEGCI